MRGIQAEQNLLKGEVEWKNRLCHQKFISCSSILFFWLSGFLATSIQLNTYIRKNWEFPIEKNKPCEPTPTIIIGPQHEGQILLLAIEQ